MKIKIISIPDLRKKLPKVIGLAQKLGQEYVITQNNRPVAVITGFEERESWRETLEIISDKKAMKRIRMGLAYFNRGGKGKNFNDIFRTKEPS